jgi:hypothetical protein
MRLRQLELALSLAHLTFQQAEVADITSDERSLGEPTMF